MKIPGNYVDGFLLPVPTAKLDDYKRIAERASAIWIEHGALQYTECAIDDPGAEFCRSFVETAGANVDETVIFAWAVFADRAARDAANAAIMADERMNSMCDETGKIFDCKRMAFGGFKPIVAH